MKYDKSNSTPEPLYEFIQPAREGGIRCYYTMDQGSYVPNHWHDALEVIYLLEGALTVTLNNQIHYLTKGHFIILSPKVPHSTTCIHGNKAILIQLPSDFLAAYLPNDENLYFQNNQNGNSIDSSTKLEELILIMAELKHRNSISSQVLFQSKLFEFLYVLLEYFSTSISPEKQKQRSKNLLRLESSLTYIQENYTKSISLHEIATVASLQPEYFCRLFKKTMGITYLTYINELRLSHIYRDLLQSNLPLVRLLENHGFTNYKLFRRMFFEHFQMTPGELRNQKYQITTDL